MHKYTYWGCPGGRTETRTETRTKNHTETRTENHTENHTEFRSPRVEAASLPSPQYKEDREEGSERNLEGGAEISTKSAQIKQIHTIVDPLNAFVATTFLTDSPEMSWE